jgi:hypothetical protein
MINMSSATNTTALTIRSRAKSSERSAGEYVGSASQPLPSALFLGSK